MTPQLLYNMTKACEALSVSDKVLRRDIKAGLLTFRRMTEDGGNYYFTEADLTGYVRRRFKVTHSKVELDALAAEHDAARRAKKVS